MTRFSLAGSMGVVAVLVAVSMYSLNVALDASPSAAPRLLFVGGGTEGCWQRSVAGARAAARENGVELEIKRIGVRDAMNQQSSYLQSLDLATYGGVALCPVDPMRQVDQINSMANQTKLVTIDRDADASQRLCHFGYSQANSGRLVARVLEERLTRSGKIALLASTLADFVENENVSERVNGFNEYWGATGPNEAVPCSAVQVAADTDMLQMLADPEITFIVALDARAAEAMLKAMASRSTTSTLPIIAFDPSAAILDAVDDGRVLATIFDDPYYSSFTAIQRLTVFRSAGSDTLPAPGHGMYYLNSEVVFKENTASVRRRMGA